MKPSEIEKLYREACATKGFEPSDAQFNVWKQQLMWFEEQDLAKALFYWYDANVTFPMPAELKPLAARAKRERESRKDFVLVTSKCALCHRLFIGFHAADDDQQRYCYGPRANGLPGEVCGGNLVRQ